MRKTLTAIMLLLALAIPLFASCANTETGGPTVPTDPTDPTGAVVDKYKYIGADGKEYWKIQAEPFDWNGREFKVLVRNDGQSNGGYADADFTYYEKLDGEPVNDAAYRRTLEIEDMFNIKIVPIGANGAGYNNIHTNMIRKSVLAGDNAYDLTMNCPRNNGTLSQEGCFYDLADFPNIDLSEPWWDKNWVDNATIAGKIYHAAGDISLSYKNTVSVVLFNKQMLTDLGLESPYNLVADNKWTFDKMAEMCKVVWENLNDEGVPDNMSVLGLGGYAGILGQALAACGVSIIGKDANDIPVSSFYSERTVNVFDKLVECFYDRTLFYNYQASYAAGRSGVTKFLNNELLFFWNEMYNVLLLRQMDTDFGILPAPKFDSSQSRYYHDINNWESMILAIPKYGPDDEIEKIGAVVSALATLGKNYLTPAYYETTLKGKVTRDDDSEKMLDVIYDNVAIDMGQMYDIGGMGEGFNNVHRQLVTDITSWYMAREGQVQLAIEKFVDSYLSLEN